MMYNFYYVINVYRDNFIYIVGHAQSIAIFHIGRCYFVGAKAVKLGVFARVARHFVVWKPLLKSETGDNFEVKCHRFRVRRGLNFPARCPGNACQPAETAPSRHPPHPYNNMYREFVLKKISPMCHKLTNLMRAL